LPEANLLLSVRTLTTMTTIIGVSETCHNSHQRSYIGIQISTDRRSSMDWILISQWHSLKDE
jgi:hypothetical protein